MAEKFNKKEQGQMEHLISYYQTDFFQYVIKPGKQKKGLTHISVEDIKNYIIKSEESIGSSVGTSRKLDPRIASEVAQRLFDNYVAADTLNKDGEIQAIKNPWTDYKAQVPKFYPREYDGYTTKKKEYYGNGGWDRYGC